MSKIILTPDFYSSFETRFEPGYEFKPTEHWLKPIISYLRHVRAQGAAVFEAETRAAIDRYTRLADLVEGAAGSYFRHVVDGVVPEGGEGELVVGAHIDMPLGAFVRRLFLPVNDVTSKKTPREGDWYVIGYEGLVDVLDDAKPETTLTFESTSRTDARRDHRAA